MRGTLTASNAINVCVCSFSFAIFSDLIALRRIISKRRLLPIVFAFRFPLIISDFDCKLDRISCDNNNHQRALCAIRCATWFVFQVFSSVCLHVFCRCRCVRVLNSRRTWDSLCATIIIIRCNCLFFLGVDIRHTTFYILQIENGTHCENCKAAPLIHVPNNIFD